MYKNVDDSRRTSLLLPSLLHNNVLFPAVQLSTEVVTPTETRRTKEAVKVKNKNQKNNNA